MGRIDEVKHDADVMERVLGIADQPANYEELHTDVVDLEVHPWLTESPSDARDKHERARLFIVKDRRVKDRRGRS